MALDQDILTWYLRLPRNGDDAHIGALGPVGAVLQCALDVQIIDNSRFQHLKAVLVDDVAASAATSSQSASPAVGPVPLYDRDFSTFVPASAPLAANAAEVIAIPAGAFIAFVVVDDPPDPQVSTKGMRHLLHLMLSVGDGWAIGVGNHAAGIASDEWRAIDIAKELAWLPPDSANQHDSIDVPMPAGAKRHARIHFVAPGQPLERMLAWGHPHATRRAELADAIVQAAAAGSPLVLWQRSSTARGFFRPHIQFKVPAQVYLDFFNSPSGMRGAYHVSGDEGDRYTREILQRIAAVIAPKLPGIAIKERRNGKLMDYQPAQDQLDQLVTSIATGKMWPNEKDELAPASQPFDSDEWNDRHRRRLLPSRRWVLAGRDQRKIAFFAIPEVVQALADADTALAAEQETMGVMGFSSTLLEKRIDTQCCLRGRYFFGLGSNSNNIDVKGAWMNAAGRFGDFEPLVKIGRKYQIELFGFT